MSQHHRQSHAAPDVALTFVLLALIGTCLAFLWDVIFPHKARVKKVYTPRKPVKKRGEI